MLEEIHERAVMQMIMIMIMWCQTGWRVELECYPYYDVGCFGLRRMANFLLAKQRYGLEKMLLLR
jgi:hypothetical protein